MTHGPTKPCGTLFHRVRGKYVAQKSQFHHFYQCYKLVTDYSDSERCLFADIFEIRFAPILMKTDIEKWIYLWIDPFCAIMCDHHAVTFSAHFVCLQNKMRCPGLFPAVSHFVLQTHKV